MKNFCIHHFEFRPVSKHPYSKKIMSHSYWNLTFCSVSFKNPSLDFAFPNLFLVRMKTFTWSNLIFILSAICPSESRSWRVTNELDYMGGGFVGKNSLCQSPVLPFACERLWLRCLRCKLVTMLVSVPPSRQDTTSLKRSVKLGLFSLLQGLFSGTAQRTRRTHF